MLRSLFTLLFFLTFSTLSLAQNVLSPYESSHLSLQGSVLKMELTMKDGAYLYRNKIGFFADNKPLSFLNLPKGEQKNDPNFGTVETLSGQTSYTASLPPQTKQVVAVDQSCSASQGICFPPRATSLNVISGQTTELSMVEAARFGLAWEKHLQNEKPLLEKNDPVIITSQSSRWGSFAPRIDAVEPTLSLENNKSPILNPIADNTSDLRNAHAVISDPMISNKNALTFSLSSADFFSKTLQESPFFSLVLFFVAGLLLSMTPCNWPILPLLARSLIRQNSQQKVSSNRPAEKHLRSSISLILCYLLGFCFVYAMLGIIAATLGSVVASFLTSTPGALLMASLLAIMGLSSLGFFEIAMPSSFQNYLSHLQNHLQQKSPWVSSGGSGVLGALLASPCVAAPLAGALLFCSTQGSISLAAGALFCLAIGLCAPLIFIAFFGTAFLPKSGTWMIFVRQLLGLLMLVLAARSLSPLMPPSYNVALIGILLLLFSNGYVFLPRFKQIAQTQASSIPMGRQFAILSIALIGAAQVVGAYEGASNPLNPLSPWTQPQNIRSSFVFDQAFRIKSKTELHAFLAQSAKDGYPVALLASAQWCTNCKSLEHSTLSDPAAGKALQHHHIAIADFTELGDSETTLLKELALAGPPALLIYPMGAKHPSKRLSGIFSIRDLQQAVKMEASSSIGMLDSITSHPLTK